MRRCSGGVERVEKDRGAEDGWGAGLEAEMGHEALRLGLLGWWGNDDAGSCQRKGMGDMPLELALAPRVHPDICNHDEGKDGCAGADRCEEEGGEADIASV